MAKKKEPNVVRPISNSLKAVVEDFRENMKTTGVKLKGKTYDEVLELLVDYGQTMLAEHAQQARSDQA
jgi:hypothetical protein